MSRLLACASNYLGRTAVVLDNNAFSYETVLSAADAIRSDLTRKLRNPASAPSPSTSPTASAGTRTAATAPPRVGLYAAPGPEYLAATWAVWQAGGIVVPLATSHPPSELSYVCQDAGVSAVRPSSPRPGIPAGHHSTPAGCRTAAATAAEGHCYWSCSRGRQRHWQRQRTGVRDRSAAAAA
ncbi:hypothetical protein Agub_g11223 [Astrephomene gubernaculifera]|uniref:AMP-dependent synthetase/ligase domain-containing protein n=1 Tax=Astrephomene gubernaculifera TaxID=47775 RepID=A0AAD3DWK8_9CHLO|nr:hypothetical protein Agub_g11223 [Astrephomene gubernaculifera]